MVREMILGMVVGLIIGLLIKCKVLHEDNVQIIDRLDKLIELKK